MLSVIILSYRRKESLRRTLRELHALRIPVGTQTPPHAPHLADAEVIVMDNASGDGTVEEVLSEFPRVRFLELPDNIGVEAFNRGAAVAKGDLLLILDDDAWPDAQGFQAALEAMASEPDLAAIALHPRHPETQRSEWPFARTRSDFWPFMGCGNLVRAAVWKLVGGYEPAFFLYRNDTDLALKILESGGQVRFDPHWIVHHDSPAAAVKSERWLHLATRNWMWLCRRHATGGTKLSAMFAGAAWALRLAGWNRRRIACVLRGMRQGALSRRPPLPAPLRPNNAAFRALLKLQLGRARTGPTPERAAS